MAEEHLSLKWNNHQAHFVDILTFLREKGMFVDVTLACGGKIYSAHKFVLSTCSDYFQKIFSKNTSTNPIVFMKDVSCNDIEALLDFMYHGEVNVPQSSLGSLIKTAEGLQIKGLAVPDDPPSSRKKQDRDKRERDPSSSSHYESRSPPPKRRSRNSPPPPPRRSNARAIPPPVEACLDNDTDDVVLRNSEPSTNNHDRHSSSGTHNKKLHQRASHDSSEDLSSDGKGVNDKDLNQESHDPEAHPASGADDASEQDAGPSGLRQSKQEEVEIKQEDVVELGEDDDDGVDWGGGMGDDGGGGDGNNDGLNSGDNSVSFSDVLLPPPEGGGGLMDGTGTGDSAMDHLLFFSRPLSQGLSPHHDEFRPHQCSFCGRTFKRKDHRTEHERIHTGERPYKCNECGRSFVQKQQLVGHMRRLHEHLSAEPIVTDVNATAAASQKLPYSQYVDPGLFLNRSSNETSRLAHPRLGREGTSSAHSYTPFAADEPLAQLTALVSAPRSSRLLPP
ncbi:broad-complex core protein isoforms 1/2/3/4/5 isoform X9 [Hyalella azteca]|uniref:Broad-complex core protein isoforms 1/2/3/4/5 isoform X9 n=1 Tax=Hyalella azteca TaxID=294128 RepID=A0A8B7PH51_HYAAZ|nr:broad-complex core protein isoforms 1/2/3/4/5 isoform X9 [Hyalella azteca]